MRAHPSQQPDSHPAMHLLPESDVIRMAHSKSSHRWLREHFDDEYVKRAQRDGYRSRAVYKLEEIQHRHRVLKKGMTVIDLGAAPGSWAQYAVQLVGKQGRVIALDILPMEPLPGVRFITGDFREQEVFDNLLNAIGNNPVDLVLSDMAPNITGMNAVDQPRAMYLTELAVELADKVLGPGGTVVVKAFHGQGFDDLVRDLRTRFKRVSVRKPKASRPRSREVYVVASH